VLPLPQEPTSGTDTINSFAASLCNVKRKVLFVWRLSDHSIGRSYCRWFLVSVLTLAACN
jgi:hypothetical protein